MANQDIKLVVSEFRIGFWNIMNKIDESEIFCMFLLVHASFVCLFVIPYFSQTIWWLKKLWAFSFKFGCIIQWGKIKDFSIENALLFLLWQWSVIPAIVSYFQHMLSQRSETILCNNMHLAHQFRIYISCFFRNFFVGFDLLDMDFCLKIKIDKKMLI